MKKIKKILNEEAVTKRNKFEDLYNIAIKNLAFSNAQLEIFKNKIDEIDIMTDDIFVKETIDIIRKQHALDTLYFYQKILGIDNDNKN